jgi:phosphate transport system substrate-binding protein
MGLGTLSVLLAVSGCGASRSGDSATGTPAAGGGSDSAALTGSIRIDGSSTVYPVSQAAAESFGDEQPRVKISVSQSGTSAGMGKFLLGEIDICDASRPIKDSEIEQAKAAGIEFVEFTVALDGLAVVVNPQNDWCDTLTVDQLKTIWRPEADGTVTNWNQIESSWPDVPLKLYGPGTASGTFEYFTEVICGEKKASRPDYQPSENDNMLVRGVAGEKGGLGYFGYAYFAENQDKLKLIAVDDGEGAVKPSPATVKDGSYKPLSRPIFIYVNKKLLSRPEGAAFVRFYVDHAAELATDAQYVAVSPEIAARNQDRLKESL